jgi:hypothetical protein
MKESDKILIIAGAAIASALFVACIINALN